MKAHEGFILVEGGALSSACRGRLLNQHRARVRSPVSPRRASITIAPKRVEETAARLITPIIDSADLHRGVVPRRRFFSAARDSADSWKQPGELAAVHGWAEGAARGKEGGGEVGEGRGGGGVLAGRD